ncbi:MAG: hypothetical protein IJC54_02975, partial [Clostridia bacterium]|nr:hypothetical protein [Clostridia bacterium]
MHSAYWTNVREKIRKDNFFIYNQSPRSPPGLFGCGNNGEGVKPTVVIIMRFRAQGKIQKFPKRSKIEKNGGVDWKNARS